MVCALGFLQGFARLRKATESDFRLIIRALSLHVSIFTPNESSMAQELEYSVLTQSA